METETIIGGLILVVIVSLIVIYYMIGRIKSLTMQLESSETKLKDSETKFENSQGEAKRLFDKQETFQAQCHEALLDRQREMIFQLRYYNPEDHSEHDAQCLVFQLAWLQAMWWAARYSGQGWANELTQRMLNTSPVTTGHLATWRQELMAAQVYLIQLDWPHENTYGITRLGHVPDEELRKLTELVPGMRWIIERMKTRNCPFPMNVEDLMMLVERIETLEPVAPATP